MRADRLISLLMLLQGRGQMTAQMLATELEVSERTIYRDVDALSAAGVPVYCEAGPGGGIGLLDGYRSSLTALTDGEVRALFAVSVPDVLAPVGIDGDLRAALRKLAAAQPTADVRNADVYVDPGGWAETGDAAPHVALLYQAVRQRRSVQLRYRRFSGVVITATVAPLGLVAQASAWQLVYARAGRFWVQRASDILEAALTNECFASPSGFDLRSFWLAWCASAAAQRKPYLATVRVAPPLQASLSQHFGGALRAGAVRTPPDARGWVTLDLVFASLEAARAALLTLGGGVEVLTPEPLRCSVQDYAAQIVQVYATAAARPANG